MDYEKSARYRLFFIAFSSAFFVLSILFLFLVITVHPAQPPASAEYAAPQEILPVYAPTDEDALTVLFIGTEAGQPDAGTFLLARFDPAGGQIPIAVLPPQSLVQNGRGWEPISAVYRYGGADYARSALERTLAVPIDRYVRINTDSFVAAAAVIGTVEFELPQSLPLEQGGMQFTLGQGVQLLDGSKALAILTHQGYPGGEVERCHIAGELAAAIANQRIDVARSTLVDKVFETVIDLIDTDISYPDYHNRKEAAAFLAGLGQSPAYSIPVAGRFDESLERFSLSDTFVARLQQAFV